MSRAAFPRLEQEAMEREERLDEARARRREFEEEMAERALQAEAERKAGIDAIVLALCIYAVLAVIIAERWLR